MSLYDTKFTDDESNEWVKLANQYKPNFEKFIGFLINNLFDKYDIYELTDPTFLERGSSYWYGPHYSLSLAKGAVTGIIMNIEQLDHTTVLNVGNDLEDMLASLKKISGLSVSVRDIKYSDRDYKDKYKIRIEFKLDPYFDLDLDKLMENKMWYKTISEILNYIETRSKIPFVWIDTETTGLLGPKNEQLIQVSALATKYNFNLNNFDEISYFDEKIKLGSQIRKRYQQVDGGNRKILSFNHYGSGNYQYKDEKQIIDSFFNWIDELSPCLMIAQNAGFDMKMLSGRYGNKITNEVFDTKMLIQLYLLPLLQKLAEQDIIYKNIIKNIGTSTRDNGLISSSMSKIGPALGIDMTGYHDALTDCRITIQMYTKIIDLLKKHRSLDISKYQIERIKTLRVR